MVAPTKTTPLTQFFQSKVPGLPEWVVLLTLPEIQAVTRLSTITPIAFTADYAYGVTLWNKQVVTLIDLHAALTGKERDDSIMIENSSVLVTRVLSVSPAEWVAWPIAGEAHTVSLPLSVPRVDMSDELKPAMVYTTIQAGDEQALLLNLSGMYRAA